MAPTTPTPTGDVTPAELPHPAEVLDQHLSTVVQSASKRKSIVAAIEAYIRHVIDEVRPTHTEEDHE
jgi:hypothetical protein